MRLEGLYLGRVIANETEKTWNQVIEHLSEEVEFYFLKTMVSLFFFQQMITLFYKQYGKDSSMYAFKRHQINV